MKKKRFRPIFIFVGILIVVGIVAGGWYYLKKIDETAGWKIYKGNGYSFKYPPNWLEKPKKLAEASPNFESPDVEYGPNELTIRKGSLVFVTVEPTTKTLDEIEKEARSYKTPQQTDAPQILKIERIKLKGMDVLKEIATIGTNALTYTLVFEGQKFVISCNYMPDDVKAYSLCEKINSTFRLLPTKKPTKELEISWKFEKMGEDTKTAGPLTNVTVVLKGKINKTFALGTYLGNCSEMKPEQLSENEIAGVVCWWAGGTEIGIFKENERLIAKTRGLSESPQYPPSIADFKQILEIK